MDTFLGETKRKVLTAIGLRRPEGAGCRRRSAPTSPRDGIDHLAVPRRPSRRHVGVFAGVRGHAFIVYDDAFYVTENARVQQGLTFANVWWGLTALEAGYWHPLTWWSHMRDCELFGLAAGWHHVTSLLLHAVAVVLLSVTLTPWRSRPTMPRPTTTSALAAYSETVQLQPDFALAFANRAGSCDATGATDLAAADRARAGVLEQRRP